MDARHAERTRTRLLLGGLIFFVAWEGLRLAEHLFAGSLGRTARLTLIAGSLIGWLGWLYYLMRSVRLAARVRATPELEATLEGEVVQAARLKAFRAGFVAVMMAQAVPLVVTMPALAAAELSILVGVATVIGSYLLYERT